MTLTFSYYAKVVMLLGFIVLYSPMQSMGHVQAYGTPFPYMCTSVGEHVSRQ